MQDRDRLQSKASHFITWGKDFIDLNVDQPEIFVDCNPFIPGDCDGTTNSTNVPKAKHWGSEIEASYDAPRFIASLGWSTADGENRDTAAKLGVLTADRMYGLGGGTVPVTDSREGRHSLYIGRGLVRGKGG